jgi:hypothetical protein
MKPKFDLIVCATIIAMHLGVVLRRARQLEFLPMFVQTGLRN